MTTPSQIIDFSRYLPPGVYVNPIAGPQIGVKSALPTAVGLFGLTVGFRSFIQSIPINPDTNSNTPAINQTLAKSGIHTATVQVTNPNSGQVYTLNTDYTIVSVGGTTGTSNALYTISRVISGHIPAGATVQVSYQYTDPSYFNPNIFYTYADVVASGPTRNGNRGTRPKGELTEPRNY